MPNWAEGQLKVRGKQEDIMNFIKEGLELTLIVPDKEKEVKPKFYHNDTYGYSSIDSRTLYSEYWFVGSQRMFVILDEMNTEFDDRDNGKKIIKSFMCKQAWSIDAQFLAEMSVKYNVDFKIYAFECGEQYNQDIEIIDGEIVKNKLIYFKDYDWECINNMIGG